MKKSVKILIIVLCLIIVGLVTFIVVDKYIITKKYEQPINEENNINIADNSNKSEENDTNNKEGTNNVSTRLSYDDLKVDNLISGMTEKQVIEIMGEPDEKTKGDEYDIYGDSIEYKYGDLGLSFYYDEDDNLILCCAYTESPKYTFSRGLKVGDSKEKVLSSFYRESNNESNLRDIMSSYDSTKPFGKYLYGHTLDAVDAVKQSGNIEYAFINYNGYDKTNANSSYMIEYHYAEPPYTGQYAQSSEVNGTLVFDMNSEDKVTCIRWYRYVK